MQCNKIHGYLRVISKYIHGLYTYILNIYMGYGLLIHHAENPTKSSWNMPGPWNIARRMSVLIPSASLLLLTVAGSSSTGEGLWEGNLPLKNHHLRLIVDEAPTSSSNGTWSAWTWAREKRLRCRKQRVSKALHGGRDGGPSYAV